MSATMFTDDSQTTKTPKTKIPVPASPVPLRRQASLRIRGEKYPLIRQLSPDPNQAKLPDGIAAPGLQRGRSFTGLGEGRSGAGGSNGGRGSAVSRGQKTAKIEPRAPQALRGATTPQSPSRIRSLSLSLSNTRHQSSTPKSPSNFTTLPNNPISQDSKNYSAGNLDYWDSESVTTSIGSSSVASCDHASVARNGTTFSGRSMKYVFHCNQHAGATGEDYLTPTQRAHRQVKKLKYMLHQAKKDLEQKDSDILRLTKEVVELRLYKAALNSPEDKSNSSDAVTVRENTSEETTPEDVVDISLTHVNHVTNSCADSGHFEDLTNSSVYSKDSVLFEYQRSPSRKSAASAETHEIGVTAELDELSLDSERGKLIVEYERRLQELVKTHEEESHQLRRRHNDKVDELLQRIAEINQRYWQLVPELDAAKDRIRELEQKLEEAGKKLEEHEQKAQETYLKMYSQGREAAAQERENAVVELAHQNPKRVSVPELLQELQVTKNELENIKAMYRQLMEAKSKNKIDPEITLQFLKSAVYYFLTDKENSQGHLKAIQSILGFSANEIENIDKARLS